MCYGDSDAKLGLSVKFYVYRTFSTLFRFLWSDVSESPKFSTCLSPYWLRSRPFAEIGPRKLENASESPQHAAFEIHSQKTGQEPALARVGFREPGPNLIPNSKWPWNSDSTHLNSHSGGEIMLWWFFRICCFPGKYRRNAAQFCMISTKSPKSDSIVKSVQKTTPYTYNLCICDMSAYANKNDVFLQHQI